MLGLKSCAPFSQRVSLTQYVVLSLRLSVRLFQLASESSVDVVTRRRSDYCPLGAIFFWRPTFPVLYAPLLHQSIKDIFELLDLTLPWFLCIFKEADIFSGLFKLRRRKIKKNDDLKIKMNPLLAHTPHHTPLCGIFHFNLVWHS